MSYLENISQFIEEEQRYANNHNKNVIFYPCVDCENKNA
jgi:hypothetical protein